MGYPLEGGFIGEGTLEQRDHKTEMALNYAEQVCMSRCTAKWFQGK